MSGGAHIDPSNKKVALLISILALLLAISEMLGKSAQTQAISQNIEASNLWSFYQAKTIRMTTLRASADGMESIGKPNDKQIKLIEKWRDDAKRYDTEPETGEGRKELMARAKQAEGRRDLAMSAHHQYELASALVQIGIVLASTSIIVAIPALVWVGAGLGVLGTVFVGIGYLAPTLIHF